MSQESVSALEFAPPAHPLKNPGFRWLWLGMVLSLLGDQFYLVATPWLALHLTGSALTMSVILLLGTIPRSALMLVGGALSDHASPRRIFECAAVARTLLVTAVAVLIASGNIRVWHLYLLAVLFGTADALAMPAGTRYLPFLVPQEGILRANSLLQATAGILSLIGPAGAAFVVNSFGTSLAFFLNALCFLLVFGTVLKLPDPPPSSEDRKPAMWRSIAEGLRYLWEDGGLLGIILVGILFSLCIEGPVAVGLPYVAATTFHSPTRFAMFMSSFAVGGILGSVAANTFRAIRKDFLLLACILLSGCCFLLLGAMRTLWPICGLLLMVGTLSGFLNLQVITHIQRHVAQSYRGRVMSVIMFGSIGLTPLSIATTGALVRWTMQWTFSIFGAAMVLLAIGTGYVGLFRRVK
jgi:MFS family permease